MRRAGHFGLVTVAVIFALTTAGGGADRKIARKDLPPAVEKTVAAESEGATIRGLSKEVEQGETFYEAELTVDGHGRDIEIDQSGNVVEVEEELALASLPAAVQEGLRKAARTGEIAKVESIEKSRTLVGYGAVVQAGGKTTEVQVDPEGKRLDKRE